MRDYNFFSEYVFTESKLKPKKLIVPVILIIIMASVIGSYFYFEWKLSEKEDIIAEQESFLNSDEVIQTKHELEVLRQEVAYLTLLGEESVLFDLLLQYDYRVTELLTSVVLDSVPRNVSFASYGINNTGIIITGEATSRADVAEFEDNLRNLNMFSNIFVSSISYDEDSEHYSFSLDIILEDNKLEYIQGGGLDDE